MPNSRFKIVGDEFLTSIDYDDEFHVNLLFEFRLLYLSTDVHPYDYGSCPRSIVNVVQNFNFKYNRRLAHNSVIFLSCFEGSIA